ncbi:hypothetical protein [Halopseudomonas oceani]|uniref:hypothetical protein n=1 Tax=Halopseudomonas oceani TaxID=1708783 RepID=UPI002AA8E8D0|nr:hypothetical protein [Halopseudomonas oceani]
MSLYNNVEQFALDVALAHLIVHGDENTTVETEGGPVDSFAKLIAELRAAVSDEFDTAAILQRLTALESKPAPVPVQIVNASRALVLADASQYLAVDSAEAVTLTLPAQATVAWPENCEIYIQQIGDGQVTINASAVTIITEETLTTRKKGAPITLKRLGADLWTVFGSLEAAE